MHWRLLAGVSEEDVRRPVSVARRRRFSRAEQSQREPAADDQVQGLETLDRLRMHATAYVITGRISRTDPSFLTWPLLHALEMRGIEIGCHSVTHVDLPTLPDATVTAELTRSPRALECALHHPVPWLAYPYGHFDARVESLARKARYLLATTTEQRTQQSASAPLALGPIRIFDSTGVEGLAALLRARH